MLGTRLLPIALVDCVAAVNDWDWEMFVFHAIGGKQARAKQHWLIRLIPATLACFCLPSTSINREKWLANVNYCNCRRRRWKPKPLTLANNTGFMLLTALPLFCSFDWLMLTIVGEETTCTHTLEAALVNLGCHLVYMLANNTGFLRHSSCI